MKTSFIENFYYSSKKAKFTDFCRDTQQEILFWDKLWTLWKVIMLPLGFFHFSKTQYFLILEFDIFEIV